MAEKQNKDKPTKAYNEKPGIIERLKDFFAGEKAELKRVSWPDRKKLKNNTSTVLALIVTVAVLIFVFDWAIRTVLTQTGFYGVKVDSTKGTVNIPAVTEVVKTTTAATTITATTGK